MKKFITLWLLTSLIILTGCAKNDTSSQWTGDVTTTAVSTYDDFAKCVTAAGVKMYGTESCSHCQSQKKLFGDSFQHINFTDCMKNPNACAKIDRVPTWEWKDGTQEVGEKTFAELAAKTACALPK